MNGVEQVPKNVRTSSLDATAKTESAAEAAPAALAADGKPEDHSNTLLAAADQAASPAKPVGASATASASLTAAAAADKAAKVRPVLCFPS